MNERFKTYHYANNVCIFSVYFQMFMLSSVKMKAILLTQMIALFFIAALDQIQAIQNILFNVVTKQFLMKI